VRLLRRAGHCVLLRVIGGIYVLISWFCKDLRVADHV
jgi:hypothetical protein